MADVSEGPLQEQDVELIVQLKQAEQHYMDAGDGDRASVLHHAHSRLQELLGVARKPEVIRLYEKLADERERRERDRLEYEQEIDRLENFIEGLKLGGNR